MLFRSLDIERTPLRRVIAVFYRAAGSPAPLSLSRGCQSTTGPFFGQNRAFAERTVVHLMRVAEKLDSTDGQLQAARISLEWSLTSTSMSSHPFSISHVPWRVLCTHRASGAVSMSSTHEQGSKIPFRLTVNCRHQEWPPLQPNYPPDALAPCPRLLSPCLDVHW